MFRLNRNAGFIHAALAAFKKLLRKKGNGGDKMQTTENAKRSKGGRPKKAIKQNHFIGIKCSLIEKTFLKQKAKSVGLSLSEFVREAALKGQAVRQFKLIPKDILQFTATLNHLAANMNQVAKKCNQNQDLNVYERSDLIKLSEDIKGLANNIKNHLV